jgi:hypothetical protein
VVSVGINRISICNRSQRHEAGTNWLSPRMDCGWQNQERGASNHSEHLRSLASNGDCVERVRPQTSGMQGVLSRFAMLSLQLTSSVLPEPLRSTFILLPKFLLSRTRILLRGSGLEGVLRGGFLLERLPNAVQQFLSFAVFVTLQIVWAGFHGASLPDGISERKGETLLVRFDCAGVKRPRLRLLRLSSHDAV